MKPYELRRSRRRYSLHLLLFVAGFAALLLGLGPLPQLLSHLVASPLFVASGAAALFGKRSPPLARGATAPIGLEPALRGRDSEARFVGFVLIVIGLGLGAVTLVRLLS